MGLLLETGSVVAILLDRVCMRALTSAFVMASYVQRPVRHRRHRLEERVLRRYRRGLELARVGGELRVGRPVRRGGRRRYCRLRTR